MKMMQTCSINFLVFVFVLAVVLAFGCRCSTSRPEPDPLAGWKSDGDSGYVNMEGSCQAYIENIPFGMLVAGDVEKFIKELPVHKGEFGDRSESYWVDNISLFEDGTGQHAVKIHIPLLGTYVNYVLIYNKSNVRINTIKFISGKYRS